MSVQEIETAVAALPQHDLANFIRWFQQFQAEQAEDSRLWDEQIANDMASGRLDALIARAKAQKQAGESHELTPGGTLTPR